MELVLDFTKFELSELFDGLKLYADLTERQLKVLQAEQKARLGDKWSTYEEVFVEGLPTNLRYSVIVALVTNVEWALNHSVGLLEQQGTKPPSRKSRPKGVSENTHKIQFLNQQGNPPFSHPFEKKFLAIVTVRNAIVHNAGKPERHVATVGPFDIHLFDDRMEEAAKVLQPAVVLGATSLWIEEGAVSTWVQEAHEWLSALYDFLQLNVSIELPVAPS
jgi:hypothetical protein